MAAQARSRAAGCHRLTDSRPGGQCGVSELCGGRPAGPECRPPGDRDGSVRDSPHSTAGASHSVRDIVLVYQPYVPATLAAAERVASYLDERGHRHLLCSAHDLGSAPAEPLDLAVCFGGDGT